jgi:cyclic pyranopterin phosphate synthase
MAESMQFLPKSQVLSLEEILKIAEALVLSGVTKIRLTGGEPLVRRNILWLTEKIGQLSGLQELTLTTNGSRLKKYAAALRQHGISRINISIDSLDPAKFREITRTGSLNDVLDGIDAAIDENFSDIKLNSVILKNRNDDEILALTRFAVEKNIDIAFIEEMPLGNIIEHNRKLALCSSAEVQSIIEQTFELETSNKTTNGPSRYFKIKDSNTHVGFISPHSNNFCASCNRVRVTVEGQLLLCLGNEHSVDLKSMLREQQAGTQALATAITASMANKPEKHHFDLDAKPDIVRFMNMTGG